MKCYTPGNFLLQKGKPDMAVPEDVAARDTYFDLMVEAKARLLSINTPSQDKRGIPSALVHEYGVLQIRMLCEIIGLGCLVAHGDLVAKASTKLKKAYSPDEIFAALDKLLDDFFPVPMRPEKTETGWHMAEYTGGAYARKSEIVDIWAKCGNILHRGSLKNLVKAKSPVQTTFADLDDWGRKISNLLSNHRIMRQDRKFVFITLLAHGPEVQVAIGEPKSQ